MNRKTTNSLISIAASAIALGVFVPALASAHGFGMMGMGLTTEERVKAQATMFDRHATMLGITAAEAKQYWSEGKNLKEIAALKGISETALQEKMQTYRKSEMKTRFQELVTAGVITQAQADARLSVMGTKQAQNGQNGERKGGRGGHRGMGGMMGGY